MPRPPLPFGRRAARRSARRSAAARRRAMPGPRSRTVTRTTAAAGDGDRDRDRRALGRIARGVLEQVEQDLVDARVVDRDAAARPAGSSTETGRRVAAAEGVDGVVDDGARDRPSRGRTASRSRSARVRSIRSSTRRESRRTCARANAMSAGGIGWPASSCRSASCSVIASGPSAFLISCAAAPKTGGRDRPSCLGRRLAHGRSKMAEMPCPTPMHMLARP